MSVLAAFVIFALILSLFNTICAGILLYKFIKNQFIKI